MLKVNFGQKGGGRPKNPLSSYRFKCSRYRMNLPNSNASYEEKALACRSHLKFGWQIRKDSKAKPHLGHP